MTAVIEFSNEGVPIATSLYRGAIKSAHRFTYEEIDEYLENDKPWKKKLSPEVFQLVRDMHTLAMTLRKRRMDGGSINLVLPEVEIDLDEDGQVVGAHTNDNTESHQVIEEFMLAANEAVAREMVDRGLYLMRRIHEQPSEQKTNELTKFVQQLGIDCENLQSRFEMKKVIEASEGMPEQHAIHFAILRSMQKAIYSPKEVGHFALNSDAYCHFTSPIRRYPDLIIHRMVGDLIDGKKPQSDFDRLAMAGKHCSELEKRAADAERELIKLKLLSFMSDKVGEKLTAVITGVESFGLFAQGIEIPAEGLIPIGNLPDDQYVFDRASRTLNGYKAANQFRLGDTVEVIVALVDLDRRVMEYKFTGARPGKAGGEKRKPGGRREKASIAKPKSDSKQKKPRGADSGVAKSAESTRSRKKNDSKKPTKSKPTKSKSAKGSKAKDSSKKRTKGGKKSAEESANWEDKRRDGMTRKQREAKKKKRKKSYGRVMVESKKSKKAQSARKKAKSKAKKAVRKAKAKAAKKKSKTSGQKRRKKKS
jgi:ribonuclease R